MRKSLKISLYVLVIILVFVGVVWSNYHRANSLVRGLEVTIRYDDCDTLVTSEDVEALVQQQLPHMLTQLVKEVDKSQVKSAVEKSPYLQKCDVNVTVGRKIVVRGLQRRPIVRVFGDTSEFYMDSVGVMMPMSEHNEMDVIVASGNLKSKQSIATVCMLATYLYNHEEYKSLFDQIYLEKNGDIYLIPKIGGHVVLLGDTSYLDEKMSNLMVMYRKGMQKTGWDTYKMINLKYKNQVICRKRK